MSAGRALLVEDDELIGTMVELNLRHHGFEVHWARAAEPGIDEARARPFDVILMDLMLPGMDGRAAARALRRAGVGTPVLMMTVRDETRTKVAAFEDGVDDYLTKPFDMDELIARVKALIRRGHAAGEIPASARVSVGGGEVNLETLEFRDVHGRTHALTEKEAQLLALLARSGGRTLSRTDILEEVWGMEVLPPERTVDNFILRLRRLIEPDPEAPAHIVTVRGRGYRYHP
jgi:DNA-binding response OmpR family regulator